jgi:hypothetical protein
MKREYQTIQSNALVNSFKSAKIIMLNGIIQQSPTKAGLC